MKYVRNKIFIIILSVILGFFFYKWYYYYENDICGGFTNKQCEQGYFCQEDYGCKMSDGRINIGGTTDSSGICVKKLDYDKCFSYHNSNNSEIFSSENNANKYGMNYCYNNLDCSTFLCKNQKPTLTAKCDTEKKKCYCEGGPK